MTRAAALLAVLLLSFGAASSPGVDPREAEAAAIAMNFMARLKPQLQAALKAGPPAAAIPVCAEVAPTLAASLSRETGWSIRRVSLKPRNPAAAPDDWEQQQLREFSAAAAAGGRPVPVAEEVNGRLRYLAPQRVQPPCLLCHGENVDPDTAAALKRYYPADLATGYRAGDVRGAISLVSP